MFLCRVARELALVWGVEPVYNQRLVSLLHRQKYRALLKQMCSMCLLDEDESIIVVHALKDHATISVYHLPAVMQADHPESGPTDS